MLILIAGLVFTIVLIMILIAYQYFGTDKRVVSNRMERYLTKRSETSFSAAQPFMPQGKPLGGWRMAVRRASKYFESPRLSRRLERKLIQAGIPMRGSEFLVICCGACLFSLALGWALSGEFLLSVTCGIAGYATPLLILKLKIERRVKAFNNQLADSLVLIANSLRTGYSFLQSIEMVSREMPKPISEEFTRVLKEMNLGVTTEDALNNLTKRVNSDDLDLVVTAVLIQRQVGGNLAEVLDNISHTIRERIKIKGHIKTLTAQGKISGLVVSLLPIVTGVMIYVVNPEYMKLLFSHPLGNAMLAIGVISQVIGMLVIRKIVTIEI